MMTWQLATLTLLTLTCMPGMPEAAASSKAARPPHIVSDTNWTMIQEGEWMIEFMAPWCPACRAFTGAWEEFATWGYDLDISVGVVDVTGNPGLSGRFLVTSLPTILHIKDGVFRQFTGGRKTTDLISFIDERKWEKLEPMAWYRDPSSIQMGVVGSFFKAAMFIRGVYSSMTEDYGIPEWACYIIFAVLTIVTGLILGLLLVICCDNFFPAKYIPLPPQRLQQAAREVALDDTDIHDDTEDLEENHDGENEEDEGEDADKDGDGEKDGEKVSGATGESTEESSDLRKRKPRKES